VPTTASQLDPAATRPPELSASSPAKRQKLPVLLITSDDSLWTQVSAIGDQWAPRQVDSVDDLIATAQAGQSGVVLWDARGQAPAAAALSRIQMHSDRYVIVALDTADNAAAWESPLTHRQIAAHVPLPIVVDNLNGALERAREEIDARVALLGDGSGAPLHPQRDRPKVTGKSVAIGICVLGVCAAAFVLFRPHDAIVPVAVKSEPVEASAPQLPEGATASKDEKVDLLIERAQQAMLDRHYLDPAEGSALTLYRSALLLDPSSGEASQGLQRLAEILFAKVQSALDERKFDVALQALETARSINPGDSRLAAFDERLAALRTELGPAQIQAALNAQNFDRATQLIDEAARARMLTGAKLNQLRDEVRRRREQFDSGRLVALIGARLQQDRLLDPHNDSAAFYLDEARQTGAAGSAAVQAQNQEFIKRSMQAARAAIDQRRYGEADRYLTELRNCGAAGAVMAALQHDLGAARSQPAHEKSDQPQFLELARSRLAQGNVTEPENDSAFYYVNQLRAVDPQNFGLPQMLSAVQQKMIERAREALDAADGRPADLVRAEAVLRQAKSLGDSTDLDALNGRLLEAKLKADGAAHGSPGNMQEVAENSLTRLKPMQLKYPSRALERSVEGWVEISYTVTPKGKVVDVKALRADPAGVFEAAATDAVVHMSYKPVIKDGTPIAVTTKIRVAFRLAAK
jgi:TonB family protein